MNVIIIGGGVGGLCLAHGLRRAGIGVRVYEKGPKRSDPHWLQGYQIHINPNGAQALQQCLPPSLWAKLLANACMPSAAFQVLTEQMNIVAVVEAELMNGSSHVPIVRTVLRRMLLDGLDDVVLFGKEFVRYERTGGSVTATFRDGTSEVGDVLVGADGTRSNVRKQYLPNALISNSGMVGAACRVPLTPAIGSRLPEHLSTRLTSIVPGVSGYMIVTQSRYKPTVERVNDEMGDHLIWVFISSRSIYGDLDPRAMDGASIQRLVLRNMHTWHPALRQLVGDSDAEHVAAVPVLTSTPISRWEPSNVTLLGDAIHTMTPLQGLGGSTALRDAGMLCRNLVEAAHGTRTIIEAVDDYERAMVDYGVPRRPALVTVWKAGCLRQLAVAHGVQDGSARRHASAAPQTNGVSFRQWVVNADTRLRLKTGISTVKSIPSRLYNFVSTFSGTHLVTPWAVQIQVTVPF